MPSRFHHNPLETVQSDSHGNWHGKSFRVVCTQKFQSQVHYESRSAHSRRDFLSQIRHSSLVSFPSLIRLRSRSLHFIWISLTKCYLMWPAYVNFTAEPVLILSLFLHSFEKTGAEERIENLLINISPDIIARLMRFFGPLAQKRKHAMNGLAIIFRIVIISSVVFLKKLLLLSSFAYFNLSLMTGLLKINTDSAGTKRTLITRRRHRPKWLQMRRKKKAKPTCNLHI